MLMVPRPSTFDVEEPFFVIDFFMAHCIYRVNLYFVSLPVFSECLSEERTREQRIGTKQSQPKKDCFVPRDDVTVVLRISCLTRRAKPDKEPGVTYC
jgi:hypothetical protein